jgi:glycosyltransferase involved in cell wall biosynthesis
MRVLLAWQGPATTHEREPLARRQVPLLARLAAQGVSPHVVLLGDAGGLRTPIAAAGVRVDVLPVPLPPNATALAALPHAVAALRRVLAAGDADVLEGDEPMPAIALGLAARRRSVPLFYRRHHHGGRLRLIVASRLAARLSDRTAVSCEAMRRRAAIDDAVSLDRIDVTVSGTSDIIGPPPAALAALRTSIGVPGDARVIVVVSRLRAEKGVDVLLRALHRLTDLAPLHVVVVGDGPHEESLRRLAAAGPLPVHFLGHRDDAGAWLALATVVAIPSRREAFGRVTLEAMAAGRPLVATRVGGLVDALIDGETGLLTAPDDPPAFAAALRRVLECGSLAQRLGAAAREHYHTHHTIDHMAAAWRQAWARACGKGHPQR